ncbi:hypothetical protein D3C73_1350640 [compost metagenome]
MAVRIIQRISGNLLIIAGMVDQHIFPVLIDGEAVMPRAELAVLFISLEHRLRMLAPGSRIQQVAVLIGSQQAHAVVEISSTGREADEDFAVAV